MGLIVDKNIRVPIRDGVHLATDVYRPQEGGPFPWCSSGCRTTRSFRRS